MPDEPTKICCACERDLPASAFSPDRRTASGLQARCRECYNASRKVRLSDPAVRERERARDRLRAQTEGRREWLRNHCAKPEEREKQHLRSAEYYAAHREELLAYHRRRYQDNLEKAREASRERSKRRYAANPKAWSIKNHVRRERMYGSGAAEFFEDAEIFERDGWKCQVPECPVRGRRVPKDAPPRSPLSASIDHIVALSQDGKHTRANCRLAHLRCNVRRFVGNHSVDQLRLL